VAEDIMATYKQIQTWVKQNHGFVPQTCWIADVKSQSGLAMGKAPNRKGVKRARLCPPEKVESIRAALKHFGMI
jgi:site-specific DNA recombinase